jgi:RimJ/RimL family protein N-acetyltransferase
MTFALETARLVLRDKRLDDVDALVAYRCKKAYWRDTPIEMPTPQSKQSGQVDCCRLKPRFPRTHYFLAAVEKESCNIIGEATVYVLAHRSAEIGFSLFATRWGRGLGIEVAFRLLRFVFVEPRSASYVCQSRPLQHAVDWNSGRNRHDA